MRHAHLQAVSHIRRACCSKSSNTASMAGTLQGPKLAETALLPSSSAAHHLRNITHMKTACLAALHEARTTETHCCHAGTAAMQDAANTPCPCQATSGGTLKQVRELRQHAQAMECRQLLSVALHAATPACPQLPALHPACPPQSFMPLRAAACITPHPANPAPCRRHLNFSQAILLAGNTLRCQATALHAHASTFKVRFALRCMSSFHAHARAAALIQPWRPCCWTGGHHTC